MRLLGDYDRRDTKCIVNIAAGSALLNMIKKGATTIDCLIETLIDGEKREYFLLETILDSADAGLPG